MSDFHFEPGEEFARQLDAEDPLREFRDRFHVPKRPNGKDVHYFVGNSLGLLPKSTRPAIEQELLDWERLGVDAHFNAAHPWFPYHEFLRDPTARIVGAKPNEVVVMNALTVNLHLLMVSFYRPSADRNAIMIEWPAFPSDLYAVQTQMQHHGVDPADALIKVAPRDGEETVHTEDILDRIEKDGDRIRVLLLGCVNFLTGQFFDIEPIVKAAHAKGIIVGLDCAHAAGNVVLKLHDWDVDFAVWCTYKYLNSGPGAVAGAFIHERHASDPGVPRFGGWWGNDPETRFRMHLEDTFIPKPDADGWQVSNPSVFGMAPIRTSLEIFDEAGGMTKLREKSEKLTGYLEFLLDRSSTNIEVVTPRDAAHRGNQLSLKVLDQPRGRRQHLQAEGVVCDFREPNVIRVAPTPLYNTFTDAWSFARILGG